MMTETGYETGYVKFFDGREGKLFGFLVDELGNEVFFHYNDGKAILVREFMDQKTVDLVDPNEPLRFPKKGDRLLFYRGRGSKGPKARPWCFQSDYNSALDKAKRNLTLDEAKELLGNANAEVLEYVKTEQWWATTTTIVKTKIGWLADDGKKRVAEGEFWFKKQRELDGPDRIVSEYAVINVFSPDPAKYHETRFQLDQAVPLRQLGKNVLVRTGVYESVMWNGGSDHYVVDPANVRDMTEDELVKADGSPFPDLNGEWLRCHFATRFGNVNQVVKILAHLGGHD